MLKKIITLLLVVMILVSCKGQNEENVQKNESITINEKQVKMEKEILIKYLQKNGYKLIDKQFFKEKCNNYFGIELKDNTDVFLHKNNLDALGYYIYTDDKFLYTLGESLFYQPNIEGSITEEQAEKALQENGIGEKFIAYNKILFNNDLSTLPYFMTHPNHLIEVIIQLNYEGNENLMKVTLKNLEKGDLYRSNYENILFYNNSNRGFRKSLINMIYSKYNSSSKTLEPFENLVYQYYENFLNIGHSEKIKDSCLIYLIDCLLDFDKKNENNIAGINDEKAFVHLSNFLKKDKRLYSRLKANNYYDNPKIKELIFAYQVMDKVTTENNRFLYYIHDSDGYTNLRREKSAQSDILQTIKSGEYIEVLDNTGDWFLIKTKEGKTGYVHKSRVKSDNSNSFSTSLLLYDRPDFSSFSREVISKGENQSFVRFR